MQKRLLDEVRGLLSPHFQGRELQMIATILIEEITHSTTAQILTNEITPSPSQRSQLKEYTKRIINGEPLQYVLRRAFFYDLVFEVSPEVLIPRPETEELVFWIKETLSARKKLKIIDIGTGSGCIAITLKKIFPQAEVTAVDISHEALAIAQKNATRQDTPICFLPIDILTESLPEGETFDIIVSNPPYIREGEIRAMSSNVLEHEPHIALFVPNHDPLIFYKRLAEIGLTHLTKGGRLFLEVNQQLGKETHTLIKQYGYQNTQLKQDLSHNDRMVMGQLL